MADRKPHAAQDLHRDGPPRQRVPLDRTDRNRPCAGRKDGAAGESADVGAEGKTPVLEAVENCGERAGFVSMQSVDALNQQTVHDLVCPRVAAGQQVRSDALGALNSIAHTQHHEPHATPADQAGVWLPGCMLPSVTSSTLGTYDHVSKNYIQECLNEFCYRFNRRDWEDELSHRLLNAYITHAQIRLA